MDNQTLHSHAGNFPDQSDNNQRPDTVVFLREVLLVWEVPSIEMAIMSNLHRFDNAFFELLSDLCQYAQVDPEETQTTFRSLSWRIGKSHFSHVLVAYRQSQLAMVSPYWNQAITAYQV